MATDEDDCSCTLRIEANEAVKEVAFAVNVVNISSVLPRENDRVYLNIRTKEDDEYCVELSVSGFRIVGKKFDTVEDSVFSQYFETIYALLDQVSPKYRNTFGDTLLQKLLGLQQLQKQLNEDDGPT